jgi:ectoine hydroxylase-related dioxygenase (phytanoyl-CoA dioxygenase family)
MVEKAGRKMTSTTRVEDWARDGWTLVGGFLNENEVAVLVGEADRLWSQQSLFTERGAVVNSPTRSDRLDPVIDLSAPFKALSRDPRLVAVASELLGGEAQLMKDKFIAKPPGTVGYTTHQDGAYWQGLGLDFERVLTAVVFLEDSPAEKGAIECVPGEHKRLLTEPSKVTDPDESQLGPFTTIEAKAGDLLLLHALVPHRSGPNRTDGMRRTLMFTYGVDPRPDLYGLYARHRRA